MNLTYKSLFPIIVFSTLIACAPQVALPPTPSPAATYDMAAELDAQMATFEAEYTPSGNEASLPTPIPSATTAPTDTVALTPTQPSASDWRDAPIIPTTLSHRAIEIYLKGIESGNAAQVFAKVGDCGGTPSWFLGSFDLDAEYYSLGEYEYLTDVIDYYAGSFERSSLSANPGFNTSAVLSPFWSDRTQCNSDEGPLQCEYRLQNPSVALIMLGTNDQFRVEEFEDAMREIIEYSIEEGVLPILASKADDLEGDGQINEIIYKLALEYEIPFWNFWAAVQALPHQGQQEEDPGHLTWAPNRFDNPDYMQAGWPHRNLTALQVLDAVLQQLSQP